MQIHNAGLGGVMWFRLEAWKEHVNEAGLITEV